MEICCVKLINFTKNSRAVNMSHIPFQNELYKLLKALLHLFTSSIAKMTSKRFKVSK